MHLRLSKPDASFRDAFERGSVAPKDFDHRAHLRLAYVYLSERGVDEAERCMWDALRAFVRRNGIPESKLHATITRAWIRAVRHFMERTPEAESFDAFVGANPVLLDPKIMLTHYSARVLFSDVARAEFVAPDIQPIP